MSVLIFTPTRTDMESNAILTLCAWRQGVLQNSPALFSILFGSDPILPRSEGFCLFLLTASELMRLFSQSAVHRFTRTYSVSCSQAEQSNLSLGVECRAPSILSSRHPFPLFVHSFHLSFHPFCIHHSVPHCKLFLSTAQSSFSAQRAICLFPGATRRRENDQKSEGKNEYFWISKLACHIRLYYMYITSVLSDSGKTKGFRGFSNGWHVFEFKIFVLALNIYYEGGVFKVWNIRAITKIMFVKK